MKHKHPGYVGAEAREKDNRSVRDGMAKTRSKGVPESGFKRTVDPSGMGGNKSIHWKGVKKPAHD